jgi:hypothetical protein
LIWAPEYLPRDRITRPTLRPNAREISRDERSIATLPHPMKTIAKVPMNSIAPRLHIESGIPRKNLILSNEIGRSMKTHEGLARVWRKKMS